MGAGDGKGIKAKNISEKSYSVLFENNFAVLPDNQTIIGVEDSRREEEEVNAKEMAGKV